MVGRGDCYAGEEGAQAMDRAGGNGGESEAFALGAGHPVVEGFRLVASAMATRAFVVAAVTAEEHADVHFVGLGFEPVEITLHAIPTVVVPNFTQGLAGLALAVDDPFLVGFRQVFERAMQVDVATAGVAEEIGLAFL